MKSKKNKRNKLHVVLERTSAHFILMKPGEEGLGFVE